MELKIIGGVYRGLKLAIPENVAEFRPTKNQIREALMSILVSDIAGARVLELCAGSSIISLEMLSRGAQSATSVELDANRVRQITKLLSNKPIAQKIDLHRNSAEKFLENCSDTFDIIFFDPPYYTNSLTDLLPQALEKLASYGLCIFEFASDDTHALLQVSSLGLSLSIKTYGKSSIALLRRDS